MRLYNRYIIAVSVLLLVTTVVLIGTGQQDIDVYFAVYLAEALALTEIFVHLNHKARRGLSLVGGLLFGGFVATIFIQVVRILI